MTSLHYLTGKKVMACILLIFFILPVFAIPARAESDALGFERMWPALSQPWYFSYPKDIAVDSSGYFYVVDLELDRIQKFTTDGQFVLKWGVAGSSAGKLSGPTAIAVDGSGNVYICDRHNYRVQKFSSNGEYLDGFETYSGGEDIYKSFSGIAVDSSGYIYVTDLDHHNVSRYSPDGALAARWGSQGSGNGQMSSPSAISVDNSGYVYVVDADNCRVQKFTSDGTYVTQWGEEGDDPWNLDFSDGDSVCRGDIYADDSGNIWVADTYNVKQFTSDGVYVGSYGITGWEYSGTEELIFSYPAGISVDSSGHVYVSDAGDPGIRKFSQSRFIANWGGAGRDTGTFDNPSGLALDSDGYLYVCDNGNHRIQKFSSTGQFITAWGENGAVAGRFNNPEDIAVSSSGTVYVVDSYNHRIQTFNLDGDYLSQWGSEGSGDGQFKEPRGIGLDSSGNVYVVDAGNYRIQKFASDGTFLSQLGTEGTGDSQFLYPADVAVDAQGNMYVSEQEDSSIKKYTSAGVFVERITGDFNTDENMNDPSRLAFDQNGNFYVADRWGHRILIFNSSGDLTEVVGSMGTDPGMFSRPAAIAVSPDGDRLYVGEAPNNRVQVFSRGGTQTDSETGTQKAIIVAGGGPYSGNTLWDATQVCTNYAYRVLMYQGFSKETIYYLSADSDLDLDGNGAFDDVDADATKANLQYAITSWASDADDLVIYITDHGGNQTFRLSESELLSAADLNAWISQAETAITGNVALIYDACQSGSFLAPLAPSSGTTRILVTSAGEDERAYFTSGGSLSFSYLFWGCIFNGMSIGDAFISTKNAVEYTYANQTPGLDDTGNGLPNEISEGNIAGTIYIGNGVVSADDIPVIGSISPAQTLSDGSSTATVWARNIVDANGISRVWAVITPPDSSSVDPSEPVLTLPVIEMTADSQGMYSGTYTDFSQSGTYNVAVYAEDAFGSISFPVNTSVTQSAGQHSIDITGLSIFGDLSVNSPVTFLVSASHEEDAVLYYRFSVHPDYGTSGYDGQHWRSMTDTEWVSSNAVSYTFTQTGKYIVVVWVSESTEGVGATGIPILGCSLNISENSCPVNFTSFSAAGDKTVNSSTAFTVTADDGCSSSMNYRFSVHPDYGTASYDSEHWLQMTDTEWISSGSISYTFTQSGKYIVVVWAATDTGDVDATDVPIIGWSVEIE